MSSFRKTYAVVIAAAMLVAFCAGGIIAIGESYNSHRPQTVAMAPVR